MDRGAFFVRGVFFQRGRLNAPFDADITGFCVGGSSNRCGYGQTLSEQSPQFPSFNYEGHYAMPMPTPLSGILAIKNEKSAQIRNDVLLSKQRLTGHRPVLHNYPFQLGLQFASAFDFACRRPTAKVPTSFLQDG